MSRLRRDLIQGARQHFSWIAGGLFLSAAVLGLCIAPDYGLSWDEPLSHRNGQVSLSYVRTGDPSLWTYSERYYGTIFEMPFAWLQDTFKITSTQRLFILRHAVTFLVFMAGAFVFFLLCSKRFRSGWIALLGSVFLILSPRIFADAFYNSKDIPVLVGFIISIFTLSRFQERPSLGTVFPHAVTSALVIAIRLPGIFVPGLTALLFLRNLAFLKEERARWKKVLMLLVTYGFLTAIFTVVFWPFLWRSPGAHLAEALADMSRFARQTDLPVLYLGKFLKASKLPWHYIPVWILVTTPPLYLLLGAIGIAVSAGRIWRAGLVAIDRLAHWMDFVALVWFFGPIAAVIVLHSVLYDGWRHLFFVYPALIYLSLVGLEAVITVIQRANGEFSRVLRAGLVIAVLVSMATVVPFMVHNHPHQNVYFNFLIDLATARRNFDLDYWGLSFRKGLEYIAAHDTDPMIPVAFSYGSPETVLILAPEQLRRFEVLTGVEEGRAKYVLNNYRFQDFNAQPFDREVYSVQVDGVKISSVFKVRPDGNGPVVPPVAAPAGAASPMQRSLLLYQLGDYQGAAAAAREALKLDPSSTDAYNNIGVSALRLKNWEEAESALREALRLKPDSELAKANLAWLARERAAAAAAPPDTQGIAGKMARSLSAYQAGRYQESIDAAREVLKLKPDSAEAWNNIAAAYAAQAKWDDAIASAREAIRLKPDFQLAKNNLSWALQGKAATSHK